MPFWPRSWRMAQACWTCRTSWTRWAMLPRRFGFINATRKVGPFIPSFWELKLDMKLHISWHNILPADTRQVGLMYINQFSRLESCPPSVRADLAAHGKLPFPGLPSELHCEKKRRKRKTCENGPKTGILTKAEESKKNNSDFVAESQKLEKGIRAKKAEHLILFFFQETSSRENLPASLPNHNKSRASQITIAFTITSILLIPQLQIWTRNWNFKLILQIRFECAAKYPSSVTALCCLLHKAYGVSSCSKLTVFLSKG